VSWVDSGRVMRFTDPPSQKEKAAMLNPYLLIAYFSPETLLPVTSIVATIAGIAMMFGRSSIRFVIRWFQRGVHRAGWIAGVSRPHFRLRKQSPTQSPRR
jgi:hypothetical protein